MGITGLCNLSIVYSLLSGPPDDMSHVCYSEVHIHSDYRYVFLLVFTLLISNTNKNLLHVIIVNRNRQLMKVTINLHQLKIVVQSFIVAVLSGKSDKFWKYQWKFINSLKCLISEDQG